MPTLHGLVWSTALRKTVTASAAMVAAVAGAIVAVPPAWSAMGLPELASKFYVMETVKPIRKETKEVQLAQAETTRALYQLQLQSLQGSLYAAQQDHDKAPSQTVDQRIQELQQEIQQVQTKLNAPH